MKLFDEGEMPDRDEIRATIEAEYGGTIVVPMDTGRNNRILHIPGDGDGPLCHCGMHDDGWMVKSIAVYPPGFKDYCKRCLARMFPGRAAIEVKR